MSFIYEYVKQSLKKAPVCKFTPVPLLPFRMNNGYVQLLAVISDNSICENEYHFLSGSCSFSLHLLLMGLFVSLKAVHFYK